MRIERDKYVRDLEMRMGNGMAKVIIGARRSGKSYLLFKLFGDFLRSWGVDGAHIVGIALDDEDNEELRNPKALSARLKELTPPDGGTYYVFLDELQFAITNEETRSGRPPRVYGVLNGLLRRGDVDVYVTGSNSRFLSTDVMTEFRGRGDEVRVLPLTFAEFMQARSDDIYHAWADYVEYGGLPLVATMRTPEQKAAYLTRLFEETYLKDVVERHGLRRTQELDDLVNVLASATGSLTNPSKIQATFKTVLNSDISLNTLKKYVTYPVADAWSYEAEISEPPSASILPCPVYVKADDKSSRHAGRPRVTKSRFRTLCSGGLTTGFVVGRSVGARGKARSGGAA